VLTAERKDLLLVRLARDGRLVAKTMAVELQTSEDTIRRDLRELAADGLLQRVHGGALPSSPAMGNFAARQIIGTDAKAAVAREAAALVQPGQTVVIDGGTTALQLVQALPPTLDASVITHSPTIAVALVEHPRIDVLLVGGRLFKHSIVTCGAIAAEAINGLHADAFFMGVTGVHADSGLTTGDAEEAAIKRALARRSADTYVLASSEKIGAVSPHRVVGLGEITAVITDSGAEARTLKALAKRGVDVRVAALRPRTAGGPRLPAPPGSRGA
jgi:DeoR/GlpR family transcriptional regulator of sugar metabolism